MADSFVLNVTLLLGCNFILHVSSLISNGGCCNPDAAHFLFVRSAISGLFSSDITFKYRSRWLRALRRRTVVAWMLGSQVRILLRTWMCVCCIDSRSVVQRTPTGCESIVGTSTVWRPRPQLGFCATAQKRNSDCFPHFASLQHVQCRCE